MRRFLTFFAFRIVLICLVLWAFSTVAAWWLVVNDSQPHSDALLVLSGGRVYRERVLHAADLFRSGKADLVLLTDDGQRGSWSSRLQRNPSSVERAVLALERSSVPRDRIRILPGIVRGTSDEARGVKDYLASHPIRYLEAVTSPYHTRRTLWTLRQVLRDTGVTVGVSPAFSATTPRPSTWWMSREGWQNVGAEFVKLPYYWIRYRLPDDGDD
jgi:uncharacterized SAM-binding protein YcdF (DUF218 family)